MCWSTALKQKQQLMLKAMKWLGLTLLGGLVLDVVFNECEQVCSFFDSTPEYKFELPIGDGKDGVATSNYATSLFTKYRKHLKGNKRLDFYPSETEQMLFCVRFGPFSGSVEYVFGEFQKAFSGCIKTTENPKEQLITISPMWSNSELSRGESGQFWCRCSDKIILEEEKSFKRAPSN